MTHWFDFADPRILGQWVGAIGFFIVFLSTLQTNRRYFIMLDGVGIGIVSLHWVILGEMAGAALNSLFVLNDIVALGGWLDLKRRNKLAFLVVMAVAALSLTYNAPKDFLPFLGAVTVMTAIQQTNMLWLRAFMVLAGLWWGSFGVLTGSWPQVAFSVVVTIVHGWHFMLLYRKKDA